MRYYNDDEIIDDDENGDAYKKKISIKKYSPFPFFYLRNIRNENEKEKGEWLIHQLIHYSILFPSSEEDVVDDPIFGRVWDETAPR